MWLFSSQLCMNTPLSSGRFFCGFGYPGQLLSKISNEKKKSRNEELTSCKWWPIVGSVRKSRSAHSMWIIPIKSIDSVHFLPLVTWEPAWLAHHNNAWVQLTRVVSLNKSLEEQEQCDAANLEKPKKPHSTSCYVMSSIIIGIRVSKCAGIICYEGKGSCNFYCRILLQLFTLLITIVRLLLCMLYKFVSGV